MASPVATLTLTVCIVCSLCVAIAAVSDPSSPDAQSGTSSMALDGSVSQSSPNSSSSTSSSNSTIVSSSASSTSALANIATTVSPVTQAPSGGSQSNTTAGSGISSTTAGPVAYNARSMANPYFVSFLKDFASQNGQTLQDIQAGAVNDPQIALLWDIYAQSGLAGGTALPALGGDASSGSSSTSGSGSTIPQYGGGGQQSGAVQSVPLTNPTWYQSFFKDPSQPSTTGNSYMQPQYGSSPTSAASSLDKVLSSFFPSPSSSQQYQQQQYPKQSTQTGTLPDAGWNIGSISPQQPAQQSSNTNATPNKATIEQLSNELLMLLGKLPMPVSSTKTPSVSSSPTSSSPSKQTQPSPATTLTPSSQTASQGQPQGSAQTGAVAPAFSSQGINTPMNQVQSAGLQSSGLPMDTSGGLSSLMNFGGLKPSVGMPGLQDPLLQQQPFNTMGSRLNVLMPIAQLYNARYNAKASRDLGCRTLGEMLDMDVPRAMDMHCTRSCSMIMPGFTGKRFGFRCLCCPIYVSDHAIGMRSMLRRAEAMT